ncbi:MAG: hypothetical protein U1E39_08555 [Planctomycetota bacterium]
MSRAPSSAALALLVGAAVAAATLGSRPRPAVAEPPISAPAAPAAPAGGDLEAALERAAPFIVTVQFLLKYDGGYEEPSWAHGAVVDAEGLILVSGSEVGGGDAKLVDVKVLFGSDPKEWSAVLVARDTALDLAYVRILPGEGRPFRYVDLPAAAAARTTEPRLGETLCGVTRTGRGFDYAPAVRRLYLTCRIEAPRKMWDFTGEFSEAGLPVFDLAGNAVAVLTNQQSAEGADEDGGSHHDVFALPLAAVLKSLEAAQKRVPAALEKAAEAKKDAPADGAKPDAPPSPAPAPTDPPRKDAPPGGGAAPTPSK